MAKQKMCCSKGDCAWIIPGKKKAIVYSTSGANTVIVAFAEQGGTIKEVQTRIKYDHEARAVLQAYIDKGFGDVEARKWLNDEPSWGNPAKRNKVPEGTLYEMQNNLLQGKRGNNLMVKCIRGNPNTQH